MKHRKLIESFGLILMSCLSEVAEKRGKKKRIEIAKKSIFTFCLIFLFFQLEKKALPFIAG